MYLCVICNYYKKDTNVLKRKRQQKAITKASLTDNYDSVNFQKDIFSGLHAHSRQVTEKLVTAVFTLLMMAGCKDMFE